MKCEKHPDVMLGSDGYGNFVCGPCLAERIADLESQLSDAEARLRGVGELAVAEKRANEVFMRDPKFAAKILALLAAPAPCPGCAEREARIEVFRGAAEALRDSLPEGDYRNGWRDAASTFKTALAAPAPPAEWTATPPMEPGWYWWRKYHHSDPQIVELDHNGNVWEGGCEEYDALKDQGGEWHPAPLTPPGEGEGGG